MNQIYLKSFSSPEVATKLSQLFSIKMNSFCSVHTIKIPHEFGIGEITTIDLNNGLNVLLFNLKLKSSLSLNFAGSQQSPLVFMHCNKGLIIHELCNGSIRYQLENMRSSITASPANIEQDFLLPAEQDLLLSMIIIDRRKYTDLEKCHDEETPLAFIEAMNDRESAKTFFYLGNSDFQLSKSLKELLDIDLEKIEDFVFTESNMFNALGHFIRNYKENQNPRQIPSGLTPYDIDCLNQAKDIIIANLSNAPTIPELAKMVGINQQKLKKGFKLVFGKTVNQFLIQKRMEAAKILLSKNDNSIKEVAHQIGYSNQSHFSSKFREHFGMLPKDFVRSMDIDYLRSSIN